MFLASNICCVSSATLTARYCWLPRAVNGAKPVKKKCRRGNGTSGCVSNKRVAVDYTLTHVDGQLSQVRVKLSGEAQTSRDTGHDDGDKMVEISVCRCSELECPEANVVQRFIVDTEGLIRVLDELVNRKRGIVRL